MRSSSSSSPLVVLLVLSGCNLANAFASSLKAFGLHRRHSGAQMQHSKGWDGFGKGASTLSNEPSVPRTAAVHVYRTLSSEASFPHTVAVHVHMHA